MAGQSALGSAGSKGFFGIIRFIIRHWYIFGTIFFLIIPIYDSIVFAIETENPTYPLTVLGLRILNSDAFLHDLLFKVQEDPVAVIGMAIPPPEAGFMEDMTYFFLKIKNFWIPALGYVWIIFLPFILLWQFINFAGDASMRGKNLLIALFLFLVYMLIVNLVMVSLGLNAGTVDPVPIPADAGIFQETWVFIKSSLPFRGLVEFGRFLLP